VTGVEADPGGERKLIVDAALRVMRQNGYAAAQISDILGEAHLSTRAFYRHFQSKDDLLLALFHDNAESTSRQLTARVLAAGAPPAQLDAWVDEILSLGYDRRRARRAARFGSEAARRTAGYAAATRRAERALIAPLLEVLRAGRETGAFPAAEPDVDARTIYALVWRFATEGMAGTPTIPREEARRQVQRFVLPALGVM
jgi:AcrR family transcriptional regulator